LHGRHRARGQAPADAFCLAEPSQVEVADVSSNGGENIGFHRFDQFNKEECKQMFFCCLKKAVFKESQEHSCSVPFCYECSELTGNREKVCFT
jgi:hypothetical protein